MNFIEFKNQYKSLTSQEDKTNFIQNRLTDLMKNNQTINRIGMNINGSYSGFIAPTIGVCSNPYFSDLTMDDFDIYHDFMNFINNDIDGCLYGEPSTINVIQQFIWNYFGYNASDQLQRMDIYSDNPEQKLSIKELKGKNIGACSERSVMVQNLLKFLGFDSEILFGKINDKESHAYIVFKAGNGITRILYDPMNPVIYGENDSHRYCPGVSLISEHDYEDLKSGKTFIFDYSLVKKLFIGSNSCQEQLRRYSCDESLFKEKTDKVDELKHLREEYIKSVDEPATYDFVSDDDGTLTNHRTLPEQNKTV